MSANSKIEWTDATWNPVRGCTKVSEGCRNCYAETFAERWRGVEGHPYEQGFDVRMVPKKLDEPLHWRKPRRVFVNSMSDLFHEAIPTHYIHDVFATMGAARQHTFQVLTKRPHRMLGVLTSGYFPEKYHDDYGPLQSRFWPLPNVWLGVSVEDQKTADERIPLLLKTPAAVRFLSCEPLLGPVNLDSGSRGGPPRYLSYEVDHYARIDQVIVGGESGSRARPMHPNWARSIRDQCQAAGVPYFYKQTGEWASEERHGLSVDMERLRANQQVAVGNGVDTHTLFTRVGKKAAGRELDGRTWDEYPK